MTRAKTLAASLFVVALAGCGGGGGGSSPSTSAPGPSPAPSPSSSPAAAGLVVSSTVPAADASNVPRDAAISFTLNKPPAPATLTNSATAFSILVQAPNFANLYSGASVNGNSVALGLTDLALAGNTTYTVVLYPSIADVSGDHLSASYSWDFTTTPQAWNNSSTDIGSALGNQAPSRPVAATDAQGNVIAAWFDASQNDYFQFYSALTHSWSPSSSVLATKSSSGLGPVALASIPGGEPVAFYVDVGAAPDNFLTLYMTQFQLGASGTLSPSTATPTPFFIGASPNAVTSVAAVAANNLLTVALIQNNSEVYSAQYNLLTHTWGSVQLLAQPAAAASVQATVDAAGNITVAWLANGHLVATNQVGGTGNWSTSFLVDLNINGTLTSYSMAAGTAGTTFVWSESISSAQPIVSAAQIYIDGVSRTAPTQIDAGTSPTGALNPAVAADDSGNVYAIYTQTNTSPTVAPSDGLYLAHYSSVSNTWSQAMRVSPAGTQLLAGVPSLAADDAGNVVMLYLTSLGIAPAEYLASKAQIINSSIIDNSGSTTVAGNPNLVIGRDNVATGLWFSGTNGTPTIEADRFQ